MEKINKFWNSFRNGVIIWIFSYFVYYLVAVCVNDIEAYNNQIMKMTDGLNFFIQVIVSGLAYVVIEMFILDFMRRIVKAVDTDRPKDVVKNMLLALVIIVIEFSILNYIKVEDIISEEIFLIMMFVLIMEGIVYTIKQSIDSYKINKKISQLNEEKENK